MITFDWKKTGMALLVSSAVLCSCNRYVGEQKNLSGYVNPFIGASTNISAAGAYHGLGKTFPGATTPYGMV